MDLTKHTDCLFVKHNPRKGYNIGTHKNLMSSPSNLFIVPPETPKVRLDQWLVRQLDHPSRSEVQSWIKAGHVTVNGEQVAPGLRLQAGMKVIVDAPDEAEKPPLLPEDLPLEIVHEDEALVVIHKPSGWVVHPAPGHPSGTVLNSMLYHFPDMINAGPEDRPGLVHRLDGDTSGLLLFARTAKDLEALQDQFRNRTTEKTYECICRGIPHPVTQEINIPIGRHPKHWKRRAVNGLNAKEARTRFQMLRGLANGNAAHLSVEIETGRTHQIRVHLEEVGHPVLGDPLYGGRASTLPPPWPAPPRLLLHASRLSIRHPRTGKPISFEAALPEDFRTYLKNLS